MACRTFQVIYNNLYLTLFEPPRLPFDRIWVIDELRGSVLLYVSMNCCKLIKCRYQFAGIGYWAHQAVLDKLLRELHLGARGRKIALRWREEVRRELPPQVLNVHRLCDVAQPRCERTDALILFLYSFLVLQINLLPDGDSITQSPRHEGWACRPKVKVRIGLIIVSVMCHADQTEMSKTISQNGIIAVGERWWK